MKKNTLALYLFLLTSFSLTQAQNGLENIIVETYYVSDANDSVGSIGTLPVGSVTYRVYVDMLPGYTLKTVFGNASHELRIATTTSFFNNEDRGATMPTYTKTQAAGNSVMLDSWISVGAGCSGNFGIPKSEDDGTSTVVNSDGLLQNADPAAGIPLTTQDGLISGSPHTVTFVGTLDLSALDALSNVGNLVSTNSSAWSSFSGAVGPTADNKVLIAQITTDGVLSFELNLSLKTPGGAVEKYVAKNPGDNEFSIPSLIYPLPQGNYPPTANITEPVKDKNEAFAPGDIVSIKADAEDSDGGTIDSVEFFVNSVKVGSDATSPYQFNWTKDTLTHDTLVVVATDNDGGKGTSPKVIIIKKYVEPGNTSPVVNITYPEDGDTLVLNSTVAITANATDNDSIVKVEFFIDGVSIGVDADSIPPYTINWTATSGAHSLTVRAMDDKYVQTTSAAVDVLVVDTTNIAPTVSITAPASNDAFTAGNAVVIKANASDTDGTVVSVEFFVNNVKVGSDATSPYQFSWTSNVVGTAVALKAVATDDKGAKTTSAVVSISVAKAPNVLPVVSITSPKNGDVFALGNIVPIEASATDADGTIELVEFFVNGTLIGSDAVAPFKYNWTSSLGTAIALTAVATDYDGATDTSDVVTISVEEDADGINDVNSSALSSFNVYPSPTKGLLTIEFIVLKPGSTTNYAIYDIKGNRIARKELGKVSGKYTETMDISSFAKGQYIIELSVDGAVSSKQIIKN